MEEFSNDIINSIDELDNFKNPIKILTIGPPKCGKRFILFNCIKFIIINRKINNTNIYILTDTNAKSLFFWKTMIPGVNFYNIYEKDIYKTIINDILINNTEVILVVDQYYKYPCANNNINPILNYLMNDYNSHLIKSNILISTQNINWINTNYINSFNYYLLFNKKSTVCHKYIYNKIFTTSSITFNQFIKLIELYTCLPYLCLVISYTSNYYAFDPFKISYSCFTYIISKLGQNYNKNILLLDNNLNKFKKIPKIINKIDICIDKYKNRVNDIRHIKGKYILII